MKIKLDDKHYLNSDRYCYWITTEYKAKTGKSIERRVSGYHKRFEDAVDNYIDNAIKSSSACDIRELRADIESLKETISTWEVNLQKR